VILLNWQQTVVSVLCHVTSLVTRYLILTSLIDLVFAVYSHRNCLLRFSERASAAKVLDVEPSTGEALSLAEVTATTNAGVNPADSVQPPLTSCFETSADIAAISMPIKTFYGGRKRKPTQPYSPPASKCKK